MKKIIAVFIITISLFTVLPFTKTYAENLEVSAQSAALIDCRTGQILYEKNADQKMFPASITKILTAIIALENSNLNESATAGNDILGTDGNKIFIQPGEILSVKDLLYSLLLSSANDAAVVIADHVGGSTDDFAKMMNKKAADIGATNTHFTNPNGLHGDNHYTTARDMALIANYAMKNETFRKIVNTQKYVVNPTNKFDEERILYTENKLIKNSRYHYKGADGVKTGYTKKARHTLVASASKNGHRLISVIMGDEGNKMWEDSTNLLNYGFSNYRVVTISKKDQTVGTMNLKNLKIPLVTNKNVLASMPLDKNTITKKISLNDDISLPIQAGTSLGKLKYYADDMYLGEADLITNNSYQRNWLGRVKQINAEISNTSDGSNKKLKVFVTVSVLLVIYIIMHTIKSCHRKKYIFKKTNRR